MELSEQKLREAIKNGIKTINEKVSDKVHYQNVLDALEGWEDWADSSYLEPIEIFIENLPGEYDATEDQISSVLDKAMGLRYENLEDFAANAISKDLKTAAKGLSKYYKQVKENLEVNKSLVTEAGDTKKYKQFWDKGPETQIRRKFGKEYNNAIENRVSLLLALVEDPDKAEDYAEMDFLSLPDDIATQLVNMDPKELHAILDESVNEGISKSAIKKLIKTIDKQIDTETGGDGEALDNETLQELEQEKERLESMIESTLTESNKYSVEYSDGIRGSKEFKSSTDAVRYATKLMKDKNIQFVSVHRPGMSSTAEKSDLIAWAGDGSYWSNVAKKDKEVAELQLENLAVIESVIGIKTERDFKAQTLIDALDNAKVKYKINRLSMTLSVLDLDKKYFDDANKVVADLGLSVMMAKESVAEAMVILDATDPTAKNLKKLLKKHKVTMEVVDPKGHSGYPVVELTGDKKDLEKVIASEDGWADPDLKEFIEESKLNESEVGRLMILIDDGATDAEILKEFPKLNTGDLDKWYDTFIHKDLAAGMKSKDLGESNKHYNQVNRNK